MPLLNAYDIECIEKSRQIIEASLSVRHTVDKLAVIAGMSTTKFKTVFKEHVGYNSFEFAQIQRMKLAQKLVIENYHSIKTIAGLCGYLHASHFNTAFKKSFGITAKKMRMQHTLIKKD